MKNILIVDDKKENLHLLERIVTKIGYNAVMAEHGKQALEKLDLQDFVMVISDILMPVMDGFQLCKTIRSKKKFKNLLVVFYTATYTEKEDEELALELGADIFLRKPMEPQMFIEKIQELLQDEGLNQDKQRNIIIKNEKEIFKLYNERLIHKLEQKIVDLENCRRMDAERIKIQKIESLALLASGIAHDFNNILVGVLGNTNLIQMEDGLSSEIRVSLKDIEKATLRASELTQQLLAFSKGGTMVKKPTNITTILQESISFVMRGSKSVCYVDAEEHLPEIEVDSGQMTQVFNNILINANQAMETGGKIHISIKVSNISASLIFPLPTGPYIQISIKDQGGGIPQSIQQSIFDPYFTTKEKGSGLGLATCYAIIKRHGGYITFISDPTVEIGTTFLVFLPISE